MITAIFNMAWVLLGTLAISIVFIKHTHNCSYDYAIWYFIESIKDIRYNRSSIWLHESDFPMLLKNDLVYLFPDVTKKQWEGILSMNSRASEWNGISDGTAYYTFVIPWFEEFINTYQNMIANLGKICLENMHCTITDVVIDFLECDIPDYKLCRIRYARTATEQESFKKILLHSENIAIGGNLSEIHDDELDRELDKYKGDNNVSN